MDCFFYALCLLHERRFPNSTLSNALAWKRWDLRNSLGDKIAEKAGYTLFELPSSVLRKVVVYVRKLIRAPRDLITQHLEDAEMASLHFETE